MSTGKYDLEDFVFELRDLMKEKINTKIEQISAEKDARGIGINLPLISDEAHFMHFWDDRILNYNPALMIGVTNIEATGNGPSTAQKYQIFIEVLIADNNLEVDENKNGIIFSKIVRYSKAIKELIEENFDKFTLGNKVIIETIRPSQFTLTNSQVVYVGGVEIGTAFA